MQCNDVDTVYKNFIDLQTSALPKIQDKLEEQNQIPGNLKNNIRKKRNCTRIIVSILRLTENNIKLNNTT